MFPIQAKRRIVLTDEQLIEIFRLYNEERYSQGRIGQKVGLSQTYIGHVLHRRLYKEQVKRLGLYAIIAG